MEPAGGVPRECRRTAGATIIAGTRGGPAIHAAFANASLGHGLVREDMHAGQHLPPRRGDLADVAGAGPSAHRSGGAAGGGVVGYEAGGRIGRALINADHRAALSGPRDWSAHSLRRCAGAALLRLDDGGDHRRGVDRCQHLVRAEPVAAHRRQRDVLPSRVRGAQCGDGRGACGAGRLRRRKNILEGEAGGCSQHSGRPAGAAISSLFADGQPEILSVYNKPVPACNFAQTACQAALARGGRRLGDDRAKSRARSWCAFRPLRCAIRAAIFAGPFQRALQAKMSIQFGVAAALQRKAIAEENYQRLADAGIMRLPRSISAAPRRAKINAAIERSTNRMAMTSASCHADRLVNDRQHQEDIVANEMFERGLAIRKSVLGKEFVENPSLRRRFQLAHAGARDRILLGCGLGPRGAVEEDAQHAQPRDALRAQSAPRAAHASGRGAANGVNRDEIREVLLQVAIYCGVPAGVDAFRIAREVFAEIDGAKAKS